MATSIFEGMGYTKVRSPAPALPIKEISRSAKQTLRAYKRSIGTTTDERSELEKVTAVPQ